MFDLDPDPRGDLPLGIADRQRRCTAAADPLPWFDLRSAEY